MIDVVSAPLQGMAAGVTANIAMAAAAMSQIVEIAAPFKVGHLRILRVWAGACRSASEGAPSGELRLHHCLSSPGLTGRSS